MNTKMNIRKINGQEKSTDLGVSMGMIMVCQFISFFFWAFFGFYMNKVVKHRYGKKEDCCYCLEKPGKKNSEIIPIDAKDAEMQSDERIEQVDDEIKSRPGVHIRSLSKFFPSPVKDGQPIKAVENFTASLYVQNIFKNFNNEQL